MLRSSKFKNEKACVLCGTGGARYVGGFFYGGEVWKSSRLLSRHPGSLIPPKGGNASNGNASNGNSDSGNRAGKIGSARSQIIKRLANRAAEVDRSFRR